jgi:hypothetical protein
MIVRYEMKRYISAILIPCLLLQLCGCYSQREITIDELSQTTSDNVLIELIDSSKYMLKENLEMIDLAENPDIKYCTKIQPDDSGLVLYTKEIISQPTASLYTMKLDTVKINFENIKSISIAEENVEAKYLFFIGILLLITFLILNAEDLGWEGPF